MPKKIKPKRSFARTAPKSQEKYLIENAKKIRDNPALLLPECTDPSCEKIFKKLLKKVQKISKHKQNKDKLEKLANKKGLEGAYAGTLLLSLSEKAPYLGVIKTSIGDITYAQRGKTNQEILAACQHIDNPILRLWIIKDIAFKKQFHVYSWNNGYVCTGKIPQPPESFITFIIQKLELTYTSNMICCNHLTSEIVKNKNCADNPYLLIDWKSAHRRIALCSECATSKKNSLFTISQYLLIPQLSSDFEIIVISPYNCSQETLPKSAYLNEYLTGKITDSEFIKKTMQQYQEHLQQSSEKFYMYNGISYGSDLSRFLDIVQPKPYERQALEFILNKIQEPVIIEQTTPNKLLERYWSTYGKEFIASIIDDAQMTDSFTKLDDTPSNIVSLVFDYQQRQNILAQLPQFTSLPPLAQFADSVARSYKTFGEQKAIQTALKRPDTPKGKALAYAFLLVLGKAEDVKWQYSKEEIEYGTFLLDYAKKLLESSPKEYAQRLQELLTASGCDEHVPKC